MKIDLSKEKIEWLAFGIMAVIVLIVVGVTFFVRPALVQKKILFEKYIVESEQINSDERMATRKNKLKRAVEKIQDELGRKTLKIPRSSGSFSILSILNQEALETGIVFDRIEPKDVKELKQKQIQGFALKDFLLNFNAGYHQLGRFINRLENISPYIQVKDITIRNLPEEDRSHQIRIIIRCLVVTL